MPGIIKLATLTLLIAVAVSPLAYAGHNETPSTALRHRLEMEQAARDNPFLLLPHRPNYILPMAYSIDTNEEPFGYEPGTFDNVEMKFQVSLKALVARNFVGSGGRLYAAYTNQSWWQAYNVEISRPFRETNHEPELFLLYDTDWKFLGMRGTGFIAGISHQSNGLGGSLSRSWNRIYMNLTFEKGNTVISVKPWYRIPEPEKETPDDPRGDDNPEITRYMGPGQIGLLYRRGAHSFTALLRNNLRKENRGAVELGWTYALSSQMKGYLQIFDGYGESLIDYDQRTTRLGAGILLADWL